MNYAILLALATVIATYGIITDSTATVIGAMIIAPLMTPIVASAAAVSMGNSSRLVGSLKSVAFGVVGVIVLSMILTILVQPYIIDLAQNPQIASRVYPNMFDLLIALAAGAAGAFASGRQEIADSLAGVAIAISLEPPLCVVGITLVGGSVVDAIGSFLLFFTNFVAILVAGVIVFGLMGLPRAVRMEMTADARKRAFQVITVVTLILIATLGATSYQVYRVATTEIETTSMVTEWLGTTDYHIYSVTVQDPKIDIGLIGDGTLPPVDTLAKEIEQKFHHSIIITIHTIPQKSIQYPSGISAIAAGL
ncbi:MAG: TIGR00341 family protein [Methanoregula sp.]